MNSLSRFSQSIFNDIAGPAPWQPAINLKETDRAFEVQVEIPGIAPELVDVAIADGVLTISGEKVSEIKHDDGYGKIHYMERSHGRFLRKIRIPRNTVPDDVTATAVNGVLTIVVPKVQSAKRIQIDVKKGD